MSERLSIFFKIFAFAFVGFTFIKSIIPQNLDLSFLAGAGPYVQAALSLNWLAQYQSLICFGIAFYGVWVLTQMIREQFAAESRKKDELLAGKRAAIKAGLPYTLSCVTSYVRSCTKMLLELHDQCQEGLLPKWVTVTPPRDISPAVFEALKENIEYFPETTLALSTLIASLQIQNSKIQDLVSSQTSKHGTILKINIEIYLKDAAEISAQLSLIFENLFKDGGHLPARIRKSDVGHALIALISDEEVTIPIIDRYKLTSDDIWVPSYMH